MIEFVLAFVVFVAVVAALCIGVLSGRGGIRGSCGGLGAMPGVDSDCSGACGRRCERRVAGSSTG